MDGMVGPFAATVITAAWSGACW